MSPSKRRVMDSLVGLPFLILPGNPPEHQVVDDILGQKVRAGQVMTVWNDMLLMDAFEGKGAYLMSLPKGSLQALMIYVGQTMYGLTAAEMLDVWIGLPKLKRAIVWERGSRTYNEAGYA